MGRDRISVWAGSVLCLSPLITRVEANEPDRLVTSLAGTLRGNRKKEKKKNNQPKQKPGFSLASHVLHHLCTSQRWI